jgi:fibronectin-binding autotransporter adhesin
MVSGFFSTLFAAPLRSILFRFSVLAAFSLVGPLSSIQAAMDATGDVSPLPITSWNSTTTGYIGNTASGTVTVNGGSALSSYCAYLGFGGSTTGVVSVSGAGSKWTSRFEIYIGNSGSGTLSIAGGGTVNSSINVESRCYVGYGTASTGVVDISGTGSIWTSAGGFSIGEKGCGTLSIAGGGRANSYFGYIGFGSASTGSVNISGTGSAWSNSGYLYVGHYGSGTLSIDGGGTVTNTRGFIGDSPDATGVVSISGTGSTWTNSEQLFVGNSGGGTLSIINGGAVSVFGTTCVASAGTSTGVIAFGMGGGTLTTRGLQAAGANLRGGGTIKTTGLVSDLNLTFDASAICSTTFGSGGSMTVDMSSSAANTDLGVGYANTSTLAITNGAKVYSANGYLGYGVGSSGFASVSGSNSTWTNSGDLYVGKFGNGKLSIGGGGSVSVSRTTYVASAETSGGTIDFGAGGGTLTTQGLYVSGTDLRGIGTVNTKGLVGDLNLTFDASAVYSTTFGVGGAITVNMSSASDNAALGVGYANTATLMITNGAKVYSTDADMGYKTGSYGFAQVSGFGSCWSNRYVIVGRLGNGTLSLTGGGHVLTSFDGYIGYGTASTGVVNISGSGSYWMNSTYLCIGHSGNGTLSITDGGSVENDYGYIGHNAAATGMVNVSGIGSTWTNYTLTVGRYGNGTLSIANGAAVSVSGTTSVAYAGTNTGVIDFGAGGGTLTTKGLYVNGADLRGTGTIKTRGLVGDLYITFYGSPTCSLPFGFAGTMTVDMSSGSNSAELGAGYRSTATLAITAADVYSSRGYLGYMTGSSGIALVSYWSTWTNSGYLYIGNSGSGTLSITRGTVSNTYGYIGYGATSTGVASISGSNSKWTNSSYLYVGNSGGGALSIAAGGSVDSASGYIGYGTTSTGSVNISGARSIWTNSGTLTIGRYGSGTVTQTGGTVSVGTTLYLGYSSTGSGTYNLNGGALALSSLARGSGVAAFNFGGGILVANGNLFTSLRMTLTGIGGNATVDTQGYAVSLSGVLSGSGGLTKTGSGTLTLSGTNTFTGNTCAALGVLWLANAKALQNSTFQCTSGGTLSFGTLTAANLGGLAGSGTLALTNTAGSAVALSVGNNNTSTTFGGCLSGSGSLAKIGLGTLTLSAANTYSGITTVGAGALVFQGTASINAALTNTKTDIGAGTLVFDYSANTAGGAGIADQVRSILATSYNGGTNSWGLGTIYSTLANSHSTDSYALGWTNNTATGTLAVRVALYGDATLDGTVNIYDLGQILANYNKSGVWATGDFNYDGTVNIYDLGKILANYNKTLTLAGAEVSTAEYPTLDGNAIGALEAAGVTVVPEPSMLALLTTGAIGLLACAWRRHVRTQHTIGDRSRLLQPQQCVHDP